MRATAVLLKGKAQTKKLRQGLVRCSSSWVFSQQAGPML
jgi:hypothetical protein